MHKGIIRKTGGVKNLPGLAWLVYGVSACKANEYAGWLICTLQRHTIFSRIKIWRCDNFFPIFVHDLNDLVGQAIMRALMQEPLIEVMPITPALRDKAFTLFALHQDKDWSLCDCASFELMRERGVTQALAADRHFDQARFAALLQGTLAHQLGIWCMHLITPDSIADLAIF